ncbi:MAG: 2-oxoisovalerate dehydrogenase E2 component (dihydrolipoyl transacylase) [Paraglaciecola sp.]|jgi:2-oxoisovalerate dehydrogenase E2 component (dihydrolipoyl transacylase)
MIDFILPDIGEGIVECELLEWLIKEGDVIVEDQPVAEVMTDKATVQIPAMYSGVVKKLYYLAGEIAAVHSPLFAMQIEGQEEPEPVHNEAVTPSQVESTAGEAQTGNGSLEEFILPDIGEGIVECELVKWLVNEGDEIQEDQPVVEVMTDKALVEIPAKHSGTIVRLFYQQGDIAKVHTALFSMRVATDENVTMANNSPVSITSNPSQDNEVIDKTHSTADAKRTGKALASPAVRRLARERDIDLANITGSGEKGRVLKCDLENEVPVNTSVPKEGQAKESFKPTPVLQSVGDRTERISGMKAAMAKQMSHAVATIPHFTVSEEIHLDALIALRAQLKDEFAEQGIKLSFMPFFIKALSLALKKFPIINSQVNEDCSELTYFADHNIGMAVDGKLGLMVPNIKGVQNLSLLEIAQQANTLIDQARQGRLKSADMTGGTISISNIGVLGGTVATPVINHPEAAIVALGKIQRLPRFDKQDQVQAVNIMHISWSGDHRIIDGATMVRFNNTWKAYLEQPLTMLTTLR